MLKYGASEDTICLKIFVFESQANEKAISHWLVGEVDWKRICAKDQVQLLRISTGICLAFCPHSLASHLLLLVYGNISMVTLVFALLYC